MTAADPLRQLVANATPAPWRVAWASSPLSPPTAWYVEPEAGDDNGVAWDIENKADARLIAAAPTLAVLAADMADALEAASSRLPEPLTIGLGIPALLARAEQLGDDG